MFLKQKLEAVIIGHDPGGEADSWVTLMTNERGKIKAVARGERKLLSKMRGGLGLFSWSEIEIITGKNHHIITSAKSKMTFGSLGGRWQKFIVAQKMVNDINVLTPWEMPDENIWLISLGGLHALNLIPKHYWRLYYYFLWTLLSSGGYQIDLRRCARCRRDLQPRECYLTAQEGIICSSCLQDQECSEKIELNTIKILRLIAAKDKKTLGRIRTAQTDRENLEKISRFFLDSIALNQIITSEDVSS